MHMNEDSGQYVVMQELSYTDIEPMVYETPYTPPGKESVCLQCTLCMHCTVHRLHSVSFDSPSDQQGESSLLLNDSPILSLSDLLSFSYQISQAMDFLCSRNVRAL